MGIFIVLYVLVILAYFSIPRDTTIGTFGKTVMYIITTLCAILIISLTPLKSNDYIITDFCMDDNGRLYYEHPVTHNEEYFTIELFGNYMKLKNAPSITLTVETNILSILFTDDGFTEIYEINKEK